MLVEMAGTSTPAAPPPAAPVDPFVEKFAKYFDHGRMFPMSLATFEAIAEGKVEIFTAAERATLTRLDAEYQTLRQQLDGCGVDEPKNRLVEVIKANERAIAEGRAPLEVPNLDTLQNELHAKRQQIRGAIRALGFHVAPIQKAACDRLAAAARKVAVDLDAKERAAAAQFGMQFFPSYQLAAIAWFALEGHKAAGVHTASASAAPGDMLFGVLNHARTTK